MKSVGLLGSGLGQGLKGARKTPRFACFATAFITALGALFFSSACLAAAASLEQDAGPLFEAMPPELPANYPELKRFVEFDPLPNHIAPMLTSIRLEAGDRAYRQGDVFGEQFFAILPPRTRIRVGRDAEGLEVWDYPVGTRIAHRIFLRTVPRTIFELRMMWKRKDGLWGYGIYAPANAQDPVGLLKLHRESKVAVAIGARILIDDEQVPMRISGNRLNPQSCRACHFSFTAARHQYSDREAAGPCAFVPGNPSVLQKWAPAYRATHGYWPF